MFKIDIIREREMFHKSDFFLNVLESERNTDQVILKSTNLGDFKLKEEP